MRIRAAMADDAPEMGRVMVEAWLSGHQGQMPDEAYRLRVDEWTPEVSARGWAQVLAGSDGAATGREVLLVAEGDGGELVGLVYGAPAGDDEPPAAARIVALYVATEKRGLGIGRSLLVAAARRLADLDYSILRLGVLSANQPARRFYEAMGGVAVEQRLFDEDGYELPETVYAWSDITHVGPSSSV
jgi:ribosomal protein S18 acetylase RimI-like enzyme